MWRNLKSIMQSERSQLRKPYSTSFCLCGTFSSFQLLSCVWLFATPWTAPRQASLSITNSRSLLKLMCIESVMPSNPAILCRPRLLPPSSSPSIKVFSNESILRIRWHFRKGQAGFPGGSVVKKLPANAEDTGSTPGPSRSHVPISDQTHAPQLLNLCSRAGELQLLNPRPLDPMLCSKRSHYNEEPSRAI